MEGVGAAVGPLPLVSVLMFCRNGAKTIRRSVDSVLSQSYPNIQYVVQDGASTDGTTEILRSYAGRVELVSEPDRGTNDGFLRALLRCRGEFISVCLADEALMPCAIERAVEEFLRDPDLGAVTGDAYLWNDDGTIFGTHVGKPFNFLTYLFGDYCPNFSASFFRRSALEDVGFFSNRWKEGDLDTIEFEIWCRLGTEHKVKYVPYIFSKYGMNDDQMSHKMQRIIGELDSRCMILDKYLFGGDRFFGNNYALHNFILRRQFEIIIHHLTAHKRLEDAEQIKRKMDAVSGAATKMIQSEQVDFPYLYNENLERGVARIVGALRRGVPSRLRARIPRRAKLAFDWRLRKLLLRRVRNFEGHADGGVDVSKVWFYYQVGKIYRDRGQVAQALTMWSEVRILKDKYLDSTTCQLMLKSPEATEGEIASSYQVWADSYARPNLAQIKYAFPSPRAGERITIGYHCTFWSTDCAKAQALNVIAEHDRTRFRVIGYSDKNLSTDIQAIFDEFVITGSMTDEEFVNRVRQDQVQVLVELAGFSHGHRFSAMASRCAAVQVSYLNHTGPSRVANVDYVMADDIAAPRTCDVHYTETIYRLPGSFFCFAYQENDLPPVVVPPQITNGYTTFGCFGGPDKLNLENLRLWAGVLHRLPGSRLLIQNSGTVSACTRDFLTKQFGWLDVEPHRLILLPGGGRAEVLRNYARVDISLDTWPYCGGNTIAESLWQGVPVVTFRGKRFSSAYGASLIAAAGLGELVADSPEAFATIAASLGRDVARLAEIRKKLRSMVKEYGFGDPVRFVRKIEEAYLDMLAQKCGNMITAAAIEKRRATLGEVISS